MTNLEIGSLIMCVLITLYLILICLMHLCGIQTIDDWRESNKRADATMLKNIKMVWSFLKEHTKIFLPVLKFVKWLIHMLIKCICSLPNLIIRFVKWAIKISSGEDVLEQIPIPYLFLSDEDIKELTKRLENKLYNSPIFCSSIQHIGVIYYEFNAICLKEAYKELVGEALIKKALYIIRNYLMETRNIQVDIFVEIATPTRLVFAIPISTYGRKNIQKDFSSVPVQENRDTPVLKEEIIFPNSGEREL